MNKERITEIVNLTPHPFHIYESKHHVDVTKDKPIVTVQPSGRVARARAEIIKLGELTYKGVTLPRVVNIHQDVLNVPPPRPGTIYLVSYLVAVRLSGRPDIFAGASFVYNDKKKKVGIRSLCRIP